MSVRSRVRRPRRPEMQARAKQSLYVVLGMSAFVAASWLIFVGYLTPEMMVYFLSFKWCF